MKKFLNKAKAAFDSFDGAGDDHAKQQPLQQAPAQDGSSSIQTPTLADVTRYRYHHGTNVGSIFVQERWLTGSMFSEGAQGSSELAAAENWVKQLGVDGARQRFEHHWKDYMSDADLDWLRDKAKCTTIRLPIGFFTLGPQYCEGTAFKNVAPVYPNSWKAVKALIQRCHSRGIGVLIDLHALPGGANKGEHSGTNSEKAEFWDSKKFRKLAIDCVSFIAQEARCIAGVAGIQIVNEADFGSPKMYEWYDDVLRELSHIDPYVPVYISDGWDFGRAVAWTQTRNLVGNRFSNPVVIDTHLYWCFSEADGKKSPQDIIGEVSTRLGELEGKDGSALDRGSVSAIVGEYSCVLAESSWQKGGGTSKEELVRNFGNAQSQRYQHRSAGSFFWTYRMDWMDGGEWGFKQMTNQHAITPLQSLTLRCDEIQNRINHAQTQRDGKRSNSWGAHCQWWDTNHPGHYEHWRFEAGWNVGWNDAAAFFGMRSQNGHQGGDKIGMLDLWVLKRLRESGQGGSFVWEYEQGLRQGVQDFYGAVGI